MFSHVKALLGVGLALPVVLGAGLWLRSETRLLASLEQERHTLDARIAEARGITASVSGLDRRLRDGWASVPYLVPEDSVILADRYDPILTNGNGTAFLLPGGLEPDHPG